MHPALSVIFFTTCSGAGYGLLFWAALALLRGDAPAWPLLLGVAIALALVTAGLLSSMLHLGKPGRAWRAFSQWRTSWLSREGVLAVLTYLPALGLALALLQGVVAAHPVTPPAWARWFDVVVAIVLAASALATVACTAMIYASLKPIPAWRHRFVVPVYLLFALLCGGLLLAAVATLADRPADIGNMPALAAIVLAVALAVLKLRYWRDLDAPLPATRGAAVGLPRREVTVFERPHTEANYLTREMAFVVARRHARALRWTALLLFAVLPMLLMLPVWLFVHLDAGPWFALAAASALAGAFVERWLFFAEARHLVTLYY
jgi:DMSO reductase anchor subunit